jgi:DNA-binding NarL/FixJ family response regulator
MRHAVSQCSPGHFCAIFYELGTIGPTLGITSGKELVSSVTSHWTCKGASAMGPTQQRISVLFASNLAMTRELYLKAFNRPCGIRMVASAATGDEIIEALEAKSVDIALISAGLEDGPVSGILVLQKIRESFPHVKAVILLDQSEAHLVTIAFRAGAKGIFFPEQEGFAKLCRCVKKVHDGQVWVSSAHLHQVLEAFVSRGPGRILSSSGVQLLTKREEDIVRLVEDGLTNRQIAQELNLSEHTVRNNLFRIFDKLGVSTRVELALYSVNRANCVPFNSTHSAIESYRESRARR